MGNNWFSLFFVGLANPAPDQPDRTGLPPSVPYSCQRYFTSGLPQQPGMGFHQGTVLNVITFFVYKCLDEQKSTQLGTVNISNKVSNTG